MSAPQGLPRLLAGLDDRGGPVTLAEHERIHGSLPRRPELIELVGASGLRGRGGAGFQTAVKLRGAAREQRPGTLIVNGSETEPASAKDALLLARLPHLVLDGAVAAAQAIGARQIAVVVHAGDGEALSAVRGAIAARGAVGRITVHEAGAGYVAGEESAVAQVVAGELAKPTFLKPRPLERGQRRRPVLVQNAETLAHVALIARYGDAWFRTVGTEADPGSVLVTVSGQVAYPGVYELAFGTPMYDLIEAAGGATDPLQALLVGGYFGTWIASEPGERLRLSRSELESAGCALGSGVLIALGEHACGLHESARLAGWLADQSAGQCGPCVHGLHAIAAGLEALARGEAGERTADRLVRWCDEVEGRGACHHPSGVARFVGSALEVFADEIARHRQGRCGRRMIGLPLGRPATAGPVPTAGAGARQEVRV